jgi:hypothetical protein
MAKVVGIQYEGNPKIYTYLQGAAELQVNQIVVVPVARGWGWSIGRVAQVDYPEGFEKDLPYKLKAVHSVLGKL